MQIALSPQDAIVFPQREQVLAGAMVRVFDGLGHIELCFNQAVRDWVVAQLALPQHSMNGAPKGAEVQSIYPP
jgi:triacylglycerol lipase